jgi:serine/threonine protein kinase
MPPAASGQGDSSAPDPKIAITANVVDKGFLEGLRGLKNAGRYEIRRELGRGSSGVVYLGWDPLIKRHVAVKISRPATEEARKTFFLEAQSAGKLNHPNIMAIYDTNLHEEYCYLVMEYIDGELLSQYCNPNSLLPVHSVAEIIDSACKALDYAHNEGIVHKDIKPSNIMLDRVGAVKIADFSIAQITDVRPGKKDDLSDTSTGGKKKSVYVVGTPSYMSPEQLHRRMVGRESDVFSLGCVLYELLTGVKAFSGDSLMSIAYKILHEDPPPVSSLNPQLPEVFDEIVKIALAKSPGNRYLTCSDMAWNLKAAVQKIKSDSTDASDFFDFVHHVSFFNAFSKNQVRELVTASNIVRINKGKVIIQEGNTDDVFYILISGKVKIQKGGRSLALIGPGECFGEMAYLASQPRSATVIAETNCTLMKMKVALLNKSSESVQLLFYQRFARTLANRLNTSQHDPTGPV